MLFTYNKTSKGISLYKETDLKSHNILERQDIEKWVENYPEVLGEELLILTTEYDRFDKTDERLDLLAIDKNGILVIIEQIGDGPESASPKNYSVVPNDTNMTFNEEIKQINFILNQ